MAAPRLFPSLRLCCFHVFLLTLIVKQASSELVLEYGYTVSTVLDGHKHRIPLYPFSLLPRPGREDDLFLLDSTSSAFYALSFPISQDSAIDRYAGGGAAGCADGKPTEAMFRHPRSFAVDSKGNVYVADKANNVIRKISQSGVTTIAGGVSNKTGHIDGPAQNASFSHDFDLIFLPRRCALLISDRGNRLIRQMNLKPEDCSHDPTPGLGGLGGPMVSLIGILCLLVGLLAGDHFASSHHLSGMWKHLQTDLGKRVLTTSYDIISAVASLCAFLKMSLSIVFLIFNLCRVRRHSLRMEPSSSHGLDRASKPATAKPQNSVDQVNDLMSFGGRSPPLEMRKSGDETVDVSKEKVQ